MSTANWPENWSMPIGPGGRDVVFLESGQIKIDQPAGPARP